MVPALATTVIVTPATREPFAHYCFSPALNKGRMAAGSVKTLFRFLVSANERRKDFIEFLRSLYASTGKPE
jgi:hypothetical protein